ncbi:hypothetical protein SAMN04487866_12218 [Thermoactinomyces sp. DSM 45891]|nr:hypothetical protein SAMN04487866_12218 [Thermoactinomyces sp. DSM 45891]
MSWRHWLSSFFEDDGEDDWANLNKPPERRYQVNEKHNTFSITVNHDVMDIRTYEDKFCYECGTKPYTHVMNQHGYCEECSRRTEVIERELEIADYMEAYMIGYFITSKDPIFFVWKPGVDYGRIYARKFSLKQVMRVIGLDGTLISVNTLYTIRMERKQDVYMLFDSEHINSIDGDDRSYF